MASTAFLIALVTCVMEGSPMKAFVSAFALVLTVAVAGPAFAGDVAKATNAADCEKAGGVWDADNNKCTEKKT
jgi:hypothetical protein